MLVIMEKNLKLGLVLGRYNHIHSGHTEIINQSIKLCEKTLILIGSAKEHGTVRNPFKLQTRKGWFSEEDSQNFSELLVVRDKNKLSATELRKLMAQNNKEEWKKDVE